MTKDTGMIRRDFLSTSTAVGGAMVLGFRMPGAQAATLPGENWARDSMVRELNAWIVVAPDESVTIRIAQTESGQGIWTSHAMIVAEELHCDWNKVRCEYASANRDAKELAPPWTLQRPGKGANDPAAGGGTGDLPADTQGGTINWNSVYRRMTTNASSGIKLNQYYLQMAGAEGRDRMLMAAAALWNVPKAELTAKDSVVTHAASGRKTTYGKLAPRAAAIKLPDNYRIGIKSAEEWTLMGTEKMNLTTPYHLTGQTLYGIDVKIPGTLYAAAKACPVFRGGVNSFNFDAVKGMPGVLQAVKFPMPDPAMTRGRQFSGGVAIIADTWWHAKTALDTMPIEWTIPAEFGRLSTPAMYEALFAAMDKPGTVGQTIGDFDAAIRGAAKVVEASYKEPYLSRCRMEPGNGTVLVNPNRVDIWMGDQSPQETRFSASKITGVAEQNVYLHLTHLGGGYGRNGNGPQAEQALMVANAVRGRPVHLQWTREEDWAVGTTFRAMGAAKLKAGLDASGYPIAMEVRTAMDEGGSDSTAVFAPFPYFVPNYRYSRHYAKFHVPVGTRRATGDPSNVFYRESFIDELAHAAGKDSYQYRRELLARGNNHYKDLWIKALDMAAEMAGWGKPLPEGWARGIGVNDRGNNPNNPLASIIAQVQTVSVSKRGVVKLEQSDMAFDEGFGFVNPLQVKKQLEGQISWGYDDVMHQEFTVKDGRIQQNNFDTFIVSRMNEFPVKLNIKTFKTGHWLFGVGEEAMSTLQPSMCDAIFKVTGKRIRDLPLKNHDLSWS